MVHLYLHILLHASITDKEIGDISIKRGQMLTSYAKLCQGTGLSMQTIRTCVKKLLKTKQIKVVSSKHYTTISVVEYNNYQPIGMDEENPAWIKLYRKIEDWRWYKDSPTTHLFIHLLLNANYVPVAEGNDMMRRGQLVVTRRYLNEATNISDRSIRTCMERLQKSKEILITQKATNRPYIVTICNYDSYQCTKVVPNIQLTYNQHTTNIQCVSMNQDFLTAPKSDQPKLGVTSCETGSCAMYKENGNIQLTHNQHTDNTPITNEQPTDNAQLTTYKKVRNKEIKNNISSSSARVREEEIFEILEGSEQKENEQKKARKESMLEQLENDDVWMKAIARKFSLTDIGQAKQKLEEFDLDMVCRGKGQHKDLQDYQSHFCDWLYKNLNATTKNNYQYGISKQEKQGGSRFVPHSSKGEIYTQPF